MWDSEDECVCGGEVVVNIMFGGFSHVDLGMFLHTYCLF